MNTNTLKLLADAISDIGSWQWWYTKDDMFQVEFSDVLLYDETTQEKEPHTSTIALRFFGNSFAVFLDNHENEQGTKKWFEQFQDDEIEYLPIESYEFCFDDIDYAKALLNTYRNTIPIKNYTDPNSFKSAKHILAAKCEDVGFIVGGDLIQVVGRKGKYTEEEIDAAVKRWWDYWRDYWHLRETKDAYEKDWACEVTIPADIGNPTGKYYDEQDSSADITD